jgi:hypothetical protein
VAKCANLLNFAATMTALVRFAFVFPLVALASCIEPQTTPTTLTTWLGPEVHGEIRGEADGGRVDVVAEASQVECKREYAVPDPADTSTFSEGRLKEFEVAFNVTIDGVERRYELEIYNFDSAEVGTTWTVVPVVTEGAPINPGEAHAEFQWEWEVDSELIAYEQIATGGTVELREVSGMVGADGLVIPAGEGNFGAFVELELPDGEVAISFNAPCSIVEVEPIE